MALLDLLGRRWALRILWELHRSRQPLTFRELRSRCDDISSSLLTRRLHELGEVRIVARAATGYVLTETGRQLIDLLQPLTAWAQLWSEELGTASEAADSSNSEPAPGHPSSENDR
ncbi:winged helix-turn-helix transcriptional regulator [Nocardia sp. CA-290969]|uniref:winged helix-turn-helix transcriptional regulator n=1 Tax=Nocardia sp. CA-290969 TaxID=3239986 RepID=UPI003D93F985